MSVWDSYFYCSVPNRSIDRSLTLAVRKGASCLGTKGDEDARGARTPACRVHTHVNARMFSEERCSQESEHGSNECARHKLVT
jgi:hypothetical protein